MSYEGQIMDRKAEKDYETRNLMAVSLSISLIYWALNLIYSMIKNSQTGCEYMCKEEMEEQDVCLT